ncbi:MAG: energy transducer TonB [Gemmatimonadaceae bacterium]|nr:energy transducer TonB [Gemmatimonadaceae bacterium]
MITLASEPVGGAEVRIGDAVARSGDDGLATVAGLAPDTGAVRVRRIGFAATTARITPACGAEPVAPVSVRLATLPQSLPVVTVRVDDRPRYTGPMAGFWERRARGEGHYFTAAEIDRRNAQKMADLIRTVPGWGRAQSQRTSDALVRGTAVRMGAMSRSDAASAAATKCFPTVVIDGMAATMAELNVEAIDPRSLAGVEVYVDGARTPSEFWGVAGQGQCGVLALWSRSLDAVRHTPLERQKQLADTVYEAHEVDELAQLVDARSYPPLYPPALRRKKTAGEATLAFVVLPNGEPWLRAATVLHATHTEFGRALEEALPQLRFRPARRDGRVVAQRTQLTVRFGDGVDSSAVPASATPATPRRH